MNIFIYFNNYLISHYFKLSVNYLNIRVENSKRFIKIYFHILL